MAAVVYGCSIHALGPGWVKTYMLEEGWHSDATSVPVIDSEYPPWSTPAGRTETGSFCVDFIQKSSMWTGVVSQHNTMISHTQYMVNSLEYTNVTNLEVQQIDSKTVQTFKTLKYKNWSVVIHFKYNSRNFSKVKHSLLIKFHYYLDSNRLYQ